MHYYKSAHGWAYGDEVSKPLAVIVVSGDRSKNLVIEHTEVDPSLRGEGRGRELVMLVVEEARRTGAQIVPRCPYAAKVLAGEASLRSLIALP